MEAPQGAHVLRDDADAIGAIGDRRRQTEEEEQRQREERSARGDDVDDAGEESNRRAGEIAPGRHDEEA